MLLYITLELSFFWTFESTSFSWNIKLTICRLFERGAHFVGLDFQSHPFWDKYLEFEERLGDPENVSKLYRRIFEIPSIQFARYYEKFRARISTRPLEELLEESTLQEITDALRAEFPALAAIDFDRQLRGKVDVHFYEIYQHVQAEVTKRWTFESNIKRSYFLVNDLDEAELENWRKYLDFEEDEGDYRRIAFLYERCVVPTALYEEFWLRYVAWMRRQKKGYSTNEEDFVNGSEEDTRLIFMRASCIFVPLERPHIRFLWARFEESFKRIDTARNIHDAIIEALPGSVEAYVSHVNLERRHSGIQAAIEMCEHYQENCPPDVRCHLLVERARILWECAGDVDGARSLYTTSRHTFPSSTTFWASWLRFECSQHRHGANGSQDQVDRACALMMSNVDLTYPERVSLTDIYLKDLLARGDSEASSKYMNAEKLLHTRTSSVNQKDIPMNGDPPGPVSAEYPPTSV